MLTLCILMLDDPDDVDKFSAVHAKYHSSMFRFAFGITKNEYDAKEVVQNSFINLACSFQRISHLEVDRIGSYLYKIVKNEALKFVMRKDDKTICLDMELYNYFQEVETPETQLVEKETYARIINCIMKLPVAYRDVLCMNIIDELKPAMIARMMNKSINTVRSTIKRGRKMLKDKLREERIK